VARIFPSDLTLRKPTHGSSSPPHPTGASTEPLPWSRQRQRVQRPHTEPPPWSRQRQPVQRPHTEPPPWSRQRQPLQRPRAEPHRWARQRAQNVRVRNHVHGLGNSSARDRKTSSITKPHLSALGRQPPRSGPRRIHVQMASAETWKRPGMYRARIRLKPSHPSSRGA